MQTDNNKDYISLVREITGKSEQPLAYIHSYGCQQNVNDGEKLAGILSDMGYKITEDKNAASLIILNTCAVRESAETRVYGNLGEMSHLKKKNPDLIIGFCGCMAEEPSNILKIKSKYRFVDMVFGTFSASKLPFLLYTVLTEKKRIFDTEKKKDASEAFPENVSAVRKVPFKGSVSIMYGCDNFCSYCIVPYVRGREISRAPENILEEVKRLVNDGAKEIMLLGQNVNSYGKGLAPKTNFAELLYKINGIDGDFRIRFMSPNPKDAGEEFINAVFECEKVCKHLHLPLQSGSDRILSLMNRRYTAEQYMDTVSAARKRSPDFSITTDIIVGFPNESEDDFLQTLKIMKEVKFDNIFSFIFSRRKGTKAYDMEDKISDAEKSERMRRLLTLQTEISDENYKRFVGRKMKILFDGCCIRKNGYITGKSDEFIIAEAKGSSSLIGEFHTVTVTDAGSRAVGGEITD